MFAFWVLIDLLLWSYRTKSSILSTVNVKFLSYWTVPFSTISSPINRKKPEWLEGPTLFYLPERSSFHPGFLLVTRTVGVRRIREDSAGLTSDQIWIWQTRILDQRLGSFYPGKFGVIWINYYTFVYFVFVSVFVFEFVSANIELRKYFPHCSFLKSVLMLMKSNLEKNYVNS